MLCWVSYFVVVYDRKEDILKLSVPPRMRDAAGNA